MGGARPGRATPGRCAGIVGYMPDVMGVYDGLRVDEYLEFFAAAYQVPPSQLAGPGRRAARAGRPVRQAGRHGRLAVPGHEAAPQPGPGAGPRPRDPHPRRARQRPRPPGPHRPAGPPRRAGGHGQDRGHQLAHPGRARGDVLPRRHPRGRPAAGPGRPPGHRRPPRRRTGRCWSAWPAVEVRRHQVADEAEQAALVRRLVVDEGLRRRRGDRRPTAASRTCSSGSPKGIVQ